MKKYFHFCVIALIMLSFTVSAAFVTYCVSTNIYKDDGQTLMNKELNKIGKAWSEQILADYKIIDSFYTSEKQESAMDEKYEVDGDVVFRILYGGRLSYYNMTTSIDKDDYYSKMLFEDEYRIELYLKKEPKKHTNMYDELGKIDNIIWMRYVYVAILVISALAILMYTQVMKAGKKCWNQIPILVKTIVGISYISLYERIYMNLLDENVFDLIWYIEKVLIYIILLLAALEIGRITKATKEIANGNVEYEVSNKNVFSFTRTQSKNLNQIGEGIKVAVEDRMKSERFKTALITNVSHDLKTPLTSIVNYVDLLKRYGDDKEKSEEYINILERQSGKLKTLIEDLVEASKASTGNVKVNKAPIDINVLLNQALAEYSTLFEKRQLELDVSLDENIPQMESDSMLLWRIFDNLLNNVYKYAKEDTRVYVKSIYEKDKCQIVIKNVSKTKLNISQEELMERFVRGDESRNTEGNGLGLSIIKGFTESLSGTFNIDIDGDLYKAILEFKI